MGKGKGIEWSDKMKRIAVSLALVVSLLFSSSYQVSASETQIPGPASVECPDTWKVSSDLEFSNKKQRLFAQLYLKYRDSNSPQDYSSLKYYSEKFHWIFDSGRDNIKIFPSTEEEPNWSSWGTVMALVAPKTSIIRVIEISVKDCPNTATLSYSVPIPEPNIVATRLDNWDSTTQAIFTDEMQLLKYKSLVIPLIESAKQGNVIRGFNNPSFFLRKNPKLSTLPYELGLFAPTFISSAPYITYFLPAQPKCVLFNPQGEFGIPVGRDCKFAVVLAKSQDMAYKSQNPTAKIDLFLLDEFSVNLSQKEVTISCKKGKVIKKVKGVNPKCPTGYKT